MINKKIDDSISSPKSLNVLWILAVVCLIFGMGGNEHVIARVFVHKEHILTPVYLAYILIMRLGLILLGIGLFILFFLRHTSIRDWRGGWRRLRETNQTKITAQQITPSVEGVVKCISFVIFIIWLAFVLFAFISKHPVMGQLTDENGFTETLTVILYLGAAIIAIAEIIRQTYKKFSIGMQRWWLILFILFFIFVSGEETNWGNTYRDEPTGLIPSANVEKEFNFHNIPLLRPTSNGIQEKTYWSDYVPIVMAAFLGIIFPMIIFIFPSVARFVWAFGVPVPSKITQFIFMIATFIPTDEMVRGFFTRQSVPSELRETTCSIAFFLWIWHLYCANKARGSEA